MVENLSALTVLNILRKHFWTEKFIVPLMPDKSTFFIPEPGKNPMVISFGAEARPGKPYSQPGNRPDIPGDA